MDLLLHMVSVLILIRTSRCEFPVAGSYFWKPRYYLDTHVPTTETTFGIRSPNQWNIQNGYVVVIDGYHIGLTITALTVGLMNLYPYLHLNPLHAAYYNNAWRWTLRYMTLLPYWLAGGGDTYPSTHKVWRKRFYYMDYFFPKNLRKLFPWVKKADWDEEINIYKKYMVYAEPAFGKHMRYPRKQFRNYESNNQPESIENLDNSDITIPIWSYSFDKW